MGKIGCFFVFLFLEKWVKVTNLHFFSLGIEKVKNQNSAWHIPIQLEISFGHTFEYRIKPYLCNLVKWQSSSPIEKSFVKDLHLTILKILAQFNFGKYNLLLRNISRMYFSWQKEPFQELDAYPLKITWECHHFHPFTHTFHWEFPSKLHTFWSLGSRRHGNS